MNDNKILLTFHDIFSNHWWKKHFKDFLKINNKEDQFKDFEDNYAIGYYSPIPIRLENIIYDYNVYLFRVLDI